MHSYLTTHQRIRRSVLLQRFTLLLRTLLAVGFVAPGLTKVFGLAFAPGIEAGTPMGDYFIAFHATGAYYAFVGAAQMAAGALLLSRRTALLGAVLFFPIIANIAILTASTSFGVGTVSITLLMAAGCAWLLLWDLPRLLPIVSPGLRTIHTPEREPAVWDALLPAGARDTLRLIGRASYVFGTVGALAFTLAARGLVGAGLLQLGFLAVALGIVAIGGVWVMNLVMGPRAGRTADATP